METDTLRQLSRLIATQRASSLGTLRNGAPFVSMVLYAPSSDYSSFVLHLSRLAVHTRDILADPRVSLMICESDLTDRDPQTLSRVTLQGNASEIHKDTAEYRAARAVYLARFPASEVTFGLGDFGLVTVRPQVGRFVAGFAQAYNISVEDLKRASAV